MDLAWGLLNGDFLMPKLEGEACMLHCIAVATLDEEGDRLAGDGQHGQDYWSIANTNQVRLFC